MLAPSIFNDGFELLDHLYPRSWFGFNDNDMNMNSIEKKLYGGHAKNLMSTDIQEKDSEFEMIVDLPGFKKDEISVELDNGYLTISAAKGFTKDEAENEEEEKKGNYIRRERYSGSCSRSFYVGDNLDVEDIKANFKHGILTLIIPKKDEREIQSNKYVAIED